MAHDATTPPQKYKRVGCATANSTELQQNYMGMCQVLVTLETECQIIIMKYNKTSTAKHVSKILVCV